MITITQGERITLACVFKKNGTPEPLDSWEVKSALRVAPRDTSVVAIAAVEKLAGTGQCNITLDSTSVTPGNYILSIRFATVNGPISTINEPVTVKHDSNW